MITYRALGPVPWRSICKKPRVFCGAGASCAAKPDAEESALIASFRPHDAAQTNRRCPRDATQLQPLVLPQFSHL